MKKSDTHNENQCPHESCIISSLKGLRNGIYYGGRIRMIHTFVMSFLFKKDSLSEILHEVFHATYEHAKTLGLFVFCYKSLTCLLTKLTKKRSKYNSFFAGLIAGYIIFGLNKTNINYQIILYLLSRVLIGGFQNILKRFNIKLKYYKVLNALTWCASMILLEEYKESMQSSFRSSLKFLIQDSDINLKSWTELIPFEKPLLLQKLF